MKRTITIDESPFGRYLRLNGISKTEVADDLGVTRTLVSQWASGRVPIPAHWAPSIERITKGRIRCESLQPGVEWGVLRRCSKCSHTEGGTVG